MRQEVELDSISESNSDEESKAGEVDDTFQKSLAFKDIS